MDIEFLSVEVVISIHDEQLRNTPGEPNDILNYGRLESAVLAPQNTYHYDEHCTVFTLAAKYVWHLVKDHAFMAGNKRAGMSASIAFLKLNGYDWDITGDSYGIFINKAIANKVGFDDVVIFLETNSHRI